MSQEISISQITVEHLAQRCAEETERFFGGRAYHDRYCYELFRRAIEEGNERAWESVYNQYRTLVAGWVKGHASFQYTGADAEDFVNAAFASMWRACSPRGIAAFADLQRLLAYLKACVHTAILGYLRKQGPALPELPPIVMDGAAQASVESIVVERDRQETLWQMLSERLHNAQERCVLECSFVMGLKPRQICHLYPDVFEDVQEVYRVKQNLLERLRRDPGLRQIWEVDA